MKKRLQKMLAPNSVMFYVLFFLFAVVGLYFSRVYGAAGIVVCIILRIVSLRTNAARQRQVQELMNNIEVDGGEIRPAVEHARRCRQLSRWLPRVRSYGRMTHLRKSAVEGLR